MAPLFNVDVIAEWLRSYGVWAILISLLINILISILGLVPTLFFLSGANAVVFGFIPGFFFFPWQGKHLGQQFHSGCIDGGSVSKRK